MFFVLEIISFVAFAVGPLENTIAVHLIVFPHSVVFTTVAPGVRTFTLDIVCYKVAFVTVAIGPGENTVALLDTSLVIAFEF